MHSGQPSPARIVRFLAYPNLVAIGEGVHSGSETMPLPSQYVAVTLRLQCWYRQGMIHMLAKVAELADAPDLGSGGETHGGSSPPFRTSHLHGFQICFVFTCAQFCAHLT